MPRSFSGRTLVTLLALASAALVTSSPALSASAAVTQPVQLSLRPVGQPGSYFDVTMTPGHSERFQVELGNHASAPIAARTYAADAYSIVNGGFGVKDRSSTPTGTTTWLSYPAGVVELPAGQAATRSFTVTVPAGTAPGQYITAIALENDVPVKGSGNVSLNQLVRQAIAVSIRVPGPLAPAFAFTTATHKVVARRSVIDVGIGNTGNANLKLAGQLTIRDSSGKTVSQAPVTMGSLYAHDTTKVEVTLAGALQPGSYTAGITLRDTATGTTRTAAGLPFSVAAATTVESVGARQGQLPQIMQASAGGVSPILFIVGGVILLALIVVVLLVVFRKPKRTGRRRHA